MNTAPQWQLFKESIRNELDPEDYQGWLDAIYLVEISAGKAIIAGIPHPIFHYDIKRNYDGLIRRVLSEIFPEKGTFSKKQVEYQVGEYQAPKQTPVQAEFPFSLPMTSESATKQTIRRHNVTELPSVAERASNVIHLSMNSHFNPYHTLDSLVVGSNNRLAYKAGQLAAQMPGEAYNPFVIYGEMGLGKTHLLEAIGQAIHKQHPELKLMFLTGEEFLNDFLTHLTSKRMSAFRKRYRDLDVFLLDDLHLLAGAAVCQTELLSTLSTLLQRKRQIIITSNVNPGDIQTMDRALRSRLVSGFLVDIKAPDLECRTEILRKKALLQNIPLPHDVCEFMGRYIYSDVRKLEGALTRLGAYSSLLCEKISLEFARNTLEDFLDIAPTYESGNSLKVSPELIMTRVCAMFSVSEEAVLSKIRDRPTVQARNIISYLMKELTNLTLKQIGTTLNRTHSAVHNAVGHVKSRLEKDDFFHEQIMTLMREFSQAKLTLHEKPSQRKVSRM